MSVLFVGDIHLGVGTYPLGEDGLSFRDHDFLDALDHVLGAGMTNVVFLGDVYDTHRPSNELRAAFNQRVTGLLEREVNVFIIVGNHDMSSRCNALEPLKCSGTEAIIVDKPKTFMLEDEGIRLYCVPWSVKAAKGGWPVSFDKFVKHVKHKWPKVSKGEVGILAGHLPIEGGKVGPSNYRLDSSCVGTDQIEQLCDALGFHFGLFGHYHKAQDIEWAGEYESRSLSYVGSLERINFGEQEEEKRSVLVEGLTTYKDMFTASRQMVELKLVDVRRIVERGDADLAGVENAIVKIRLENISKGFAATFDTVAFKKLLLEAGAKFVMAPVISVKQAKPSKANRRYQGSLEKAIARYVDERFSEELDEGKVDALKHESLDLLEGV